MARTNYAFEKRQRDLAKKKKKEEKRRRKAELKADPSKAPDPDTPATPDTPEANEPTA
tara:strand:- start:338 stop:511 length:174 start_codon:yes stop_codon:yes gene_type:complete